MLPKKMNLGDEIPVKVVTKKGSVERKTAVLVDLQPEISWRLLLRHPLTNFILVRLDGEEKYVNGKTLEVLD